MIFVVGGGFGEWIKDGSPNQDGDGECGVLVVRLGDLVYWCT